MRPFLKAWRGWKACSKGREGLGSPSDGPGGQ